jgi:hypothetical protein
MKTAHIRIHKPPPCTQMLSLVPFLELFRLTFITFILNRSMPANCFAHLSHSFPVCCAPVPTYCSLQSTPRPTVPPISTADAYRTRTLPLLNVALLNPLDSACHFVRVWNWGEHRLKVSESVQVTGGWCRLFNEELHNFNSQPSLIKKMKCRRTKWAEHVTRIGEKTNACNVLVATPEGKRPTRRSRYRWVHNIKFDLREVGYGRMEWICLVMDRKQWKAPFHTATPWT